MRPLSLSVRAACALVLAAACSGGGLKANQGRVQISGQLTSTAQVKLVFTVATQAKDPSSGAWLDVDTSGPLGATTGSALAGVVACQSTTPGTVDSRAILTVQSVTLSDGTPGTLTNPGPFTQTFACAAGADVKVSFSVDVGVVAQGDGFVDVIVSIIVDPTTESIACECDTNLPAPGDELICSFASGPFTPAASGLVNLDYFRGLASGLDGKWALTAPEVFTSQLTSGGALTATATPIATFDGAGTVSFTDIAFPAPWLPGASTFTSRSFTVATSQLTMGPSTVATGCLGAACCRPQVRSYNRGYYAFADKGSGESVAVFAIDANGTAGDFTVSSALTNTTGGVTSAFSFEPLQTEGRVIAACGQSTRSFQVTVALADGTTVTEICSGTPGGATSTNAGGAYQCSLPPSGVAACPTN